MLLQAGVADVFVAQENVDVFVDPALRADGMLRFAVTSRQHILKRRVRFRIIIVRSVTCLKLSWPMA